MTRYGRVTLAVILLFGLLCRREAIAADPLAELESQQQRLFEDVAPAVVFIASQRGFGSGFLVGSNGLVLTNAHVIGNDKKVNVMLRDGRRVQGIVQERGRDDTDLALVKLPLENTKFLTFAGPADLRVGTWAAAVGHGLGGVWAFNTGLVSNIYPHGTDRPVFQTQIPLNPGNSGGPIVDRRGFVLGVVTSGVRNAENMNFAIRVDLACRTLSGLAHLCQVLTVHAPAGVPVFVDGQMVGKGPTVAITATAKTYEIFAVVRGEMRKKLVKYPDVRTVDLDGPR